MEPTHLQGVREIAAFFGLSEPMTMVLLLGGGIPAAQKVNRPQGGKQMWQLDTAVAENYRSLRQATNKYDHGEALAKRLAHRYSFLYDKPPSVSRLVDDGYLKLDDWVQGLAEERLKAMLHIPILMHPDDLKNWYRQAVDKRYNSKLQTETDKIFRGTR